MPGDPKSRCADSAGESGRIRKAGHNPSKVQQQTYAAVARGVPAKTAYEQAVNGFLRVNPELNGAFNEMAALIRSSDDATLAKYHAAIDRYNETDGADEAGINALEPMMRADAAELAARHGITQEAIDTGQVDWGAIGAAPKSAPAQPQRFEFKSGGPALAERFGLGDTKPAQDSRAAGGNGASMRVAPNSPWTNQVGVTASPTGVRVGRSAGFDARAESVTIGDARPLTYGGLGPA